MHLEGDWSEDVIAHWCENVELKPQLLDYYYV